MSTICFDDDKFSRIFKSLCLMDSGKYDLAHVFEYPEGWSDSLDNHIRSFVQALRTANIQAYNVRYNENEPVRILSFNRGTSYNTIDLIKALQSIQYNIDDQDIKGCAERLKRLINHLMGVYIAHLPEYRESTAW